MPKPDRERFNSIKWSKVCTECRHQNGDTCPMEECAATNYDENGNEILVQYDGDYQLERKMTNGSFTEEIW